MTRPLKAVKGPKNHHEETKVWASEIFQLRKHSGEGGKGSSGADEKQERLGRSSLVLLFVLGVIAGLVNGGILAANAALCKIQAQIITFGGNFSIGLLYFLLIMCTLVTCASCACKYGSRAAAGSGLPEFKYLLGSEMGVVGYEKLISLRILLFKIVGLVFSVGGGLSVGSEGPLVHTAACVAYVLMKYIPEFSEILDSQSITKQIFAASAAVGVSSAFNAPVGGLLFSIEVTSTFYLVANYWRSFIAAMAGAVACNLLLITKEGANSDPLLTLQMSDNQKNQYSKWELAVFLAIGLIFGWLAHFYLLIHKRLSAFMKPYNRDFPLVMAVSGAVLTAMIVYFTQQFSKESVGVVALVSDVLNKGKVTEMKGIPFFADKPMEALLLCFGLRIVLTLIGTNILVPAGIFMPVVLIGGLLGRFVGHVVSDMGFDCYIPGYALVGACAFSAGITHTISVSMIMVEMTGDLKMLLPCLVVSVIAAGITKASGISVYDIGMINKGLQTFQLLLLEKNSPQRHAGTIMDDKVLMIFRRNTVLEIINKMQANMQQQTFPLVEEIKYQSQPGVEQETETITSNVNDAVLAAGGGGGGAAKEGIHPSRLKRKVPRRRFKLIGSYNRKDLFSFLETLFKDFGLLEVVRTMLPEDAAESDRVRLHDDKVLKARLDRQKYTRAIAETIMLTPMFSRTPKSLIWGGGSGGGSGNVKERNDNELVSFDGLDCVENPLHTSDVKSKSNASPSLTNSNQRIKTPHPKKKKKNGGYAIVVNTDGDTVELGESSRSESIGGVGAAAAAEVETQGSFSNSTVVRTPTQSDVDVGTKTPNQKNYVESPGSAKSVGSNDSGYIWNIINQAVVSSADVMRMSLGLNPILLNAVDRKDSYCFDPMEPQIAALFSKEIVIENEDVAINYFPFSINERAPMEHLYVLFEMVKLQTIFVVRDGELRGMISRDRLLESLKSKN